MTASDENSRPETVIKRVIQRAGGRHLVFRIRRDPFWMVPHPYAILSSIEGSIWVFYGFGQVWLTHRKLKRLNQWWVRVPRIRSTRLVEIIDRLEPDLDEFIEQIRRQDVTGTIMIERRAIEFHWMLVPGSTGGPNKLEKRKAVVDLNFNRLATAFASWQLVGQEGTRDISAEQVKLQKKPD